MQCRWADLTGKSTSHIECADIIAKSNNRKSNMPCKHADLVVKAISSSCSMPCTWADLVANEGFVSEQNRHIRVSVRKEKCNSADLIAKGANNTAYEGLVSQRVQVAP